MRIYLSALTVLLTLSGFAQFKNTKIGDDGLQPSVTVNQKNSSNIIIACGTNLVSYSLDAGQTWMQGKMPFPFAPKGEAIVRSNEDGEVFLIHNNDYLDSARKVVQLVCQTSMSGGKSWSAPVIIQPLSKSMSQPEAMVHPKKKKMSVIWTEQDQPGSQDPACHSAVYFSETTDGKKWSQPDLLSNDFGDCTESANSVHYPSVAVDDDHKLFGAWTKKNSMVMDRSFDGGKNWLNNDMAGVKLEGPHNYTIPGIGAVDRRLFMISDNSNSVFKNSLYAVWSDQQNGTTDTDVWLSVSVRRGDLWAKAVRINKDEKGKHQFMPAMTVDQATGIIYVVFYDRRAYSDNQTDVYLAWSTTGGETFSEVKISETPFTPVEGKPFTGHIAVSAHKGVIAPVWVRMDDGKASVWSATVEQEKIIQKADVPHRLAVQPNRLQQRPAQQRRN